MKRFTDYPVSDEYYQLYARFQNSPIDRLFEGVDLTGKTVLDLCAGNGRLSLWALKNGAIHCDLVDRSWEMLPDIKTIPNAIETFNMDVRQFAEQFNFKRQYDIMACQQAINYWLDHQTQRRPILGELVKNLNPTGGVFVFNTFDTDPGTVPVVRQYKIDDESFIEVTYRINDQIYHFQGKEGVKPHLTRFKWYPYDKIMKLVRPHFNWIRTNSYGKTRIWQMGL